LSDPPDTVTKVHCEPRKNKAAEGQRQTLKCR
jgi:hypothetical protein